MRKIALLSLAAFGLACTTAAAPDPVTCPGGEPEPKGLMLSWRTDPTSTMVVDWHAHEGETPPADLCYRKAGASEWRKVAANEGTFLTSNRPVFRTELAALAPGASYEFRLAGYDRAYSFRTMPADLAARPVTFAAGGDTLSFPQLMEQTSRVALRYDIDFVAWGGDLAYANGDESSRGRLRWEMWFDANKGLVTDAGRVVPIIVAVGNHEVVEGYVTGYPDYQQTDAFRAKMAPSFFKLFAFPGQPGYGALDFGDYLTFVVLDSDHTNPVDGAQKDWLRETLAARKARGVPHVFPIYHVPGYPSHRSYDGEVSRRVREHWVPLFEAHGVTLAFENHDHTYKRTHPIREGKVENGGIVYVGDGAWGIPTRSGDQKDAWYIEKFAAENHAIIVTLDGKKRTVKAVSSTGALLDEF